MVLSRGPLPAFFGSNELYWFTLYVILMVFLGSSLWQYFRVDLFRRSWVLLGSLGFLF